MGQDVNGFCRILRDAGHAVAVKGIAAPAPRLAALPAEGRAEILSLYRRLGGRQKAPELRPGPWDVLVDGVLVEVDEQLHFNRYRALTLTASSYRLLPRFPLSAYRSFCTTKESACLKVGAGQGRWMNTSTEAHFGPSGPRGVLPGNGSSRWKQRAIYDLMKDFTQLDPAAPPLARIAIWDSLPGVPGATVEDAVHGPPNAAITQGLLLLLEARAGRQLNRHSSASSDCDSPRLRRSSDGPKGGDEPARPDATQATRITAHGSSRACRQARRVSPRGSPGSSGEGR